MESRMTKSYSSQNEIRATFDRACAAKDPVILVTQYLKFEARFVALVGDEIHVQASAGGEEALRILGISEVDMRFPSGPDFMGATAKLLGISAVEGIRTLKLALPMQVHISDNRKAPRTSLTDGVHASFALRGTRIVKASIANISVSGLRMDLEEIIPSSELRVRDKITISVALPGNITITNGAVVRHMNNSNVGVEFDPALSSRDMATLSRWVFKKKEEETEQTAKRKDASRAAEAARAAGNDILIITADEVLRLNLCSLLGEGRKILCAPPMPAPVNYAISQKPLMVILHASGLDGAGWQFLKTVHTDLPKGTPILLLGTDIEAGALSELGGDCKALASMVMTPNKARFLQQLVVGILRKSYGGGEAAGL